MLLSRLAINPCRSSGERIWRRSDVFSFSSPNGMWEGRILPESEEQLESSRITGSDALRNAPALAPPSSDQPLPPTKDGENRKRRRKRNGTDTQLVGNNYPPLNRTGRQQQLLMMVEMPILWGKGYVRPNSKPPNNMDRVNPPRASRSVGNSIRMRVVRPREPTVIAGYTVL